jgi:hypothetical protein
VVGGWRRPQSEGLCNIYASLSIIRVIKSQRMEWAEHVVCMDEISIQNYGLKT